MMTKLVKQSPQVSIDKKYNMADNKEKLKNYYTYQDLEYLVEYTDCELLKQSIKAGKLFATPEALFDNLKNNLMKYESQTVED